MSLWVRSDSGLWVYTENLSIERYYWSCYFGMAAGSLIFLISFVGCAGALLDSRLLIGIVSIDLHTFQYDLHQNTHTHPSPLS